MRMGGRLIELSVLLALGVLLGWPICVSVAGLLGRPEVGEGLGTVPGGVARPLALAFETARLVVWTELIALPLGVLLAVAMRGRGGVVRAGFLAALFVPAPLYAVAWLGGFGNLGRQQVFGAQPWLVGLPGAAFVHAMVALPWVVLVVDAGLRSVEPELEELGLLLGPPVWVWREVVLPRVCWSIGAAGAWVAFMTAGEMSITDLIPLRTYAEEAYTLSQLGLEPAVLAMRATWPQVAVAMVLVLVLAWVLGRLDARRLSLPGRGGGVGYLAGGRWLTGIQAVLLVLIWGLPVYALVWRAGRLSRMSGMAPEWSLGGLWGSLTRAWVELTDARWPWEASALAGPPWWRAPLWGTLAWSAVGASAAVGLAWSLLWLARGSRGWRVVAVCALAWMLSMPAPLIGMTLKLAYARVGWMNQTPVLMIMAFIVRTMPFAFMLLWPAVRRIPEAWLEHAALAGMGPWGQAWRVAVPATAHAVACAWLLCWVVAVGELPATYFVRAPGFEPVSCLVWSLMHMGVESRLASLGLIILAFFVTLGLVAGGLMGWFGRRVGLS